MKKIFLLIMMLTTSLFAQCQVTKFLGIPVDGFKKDMIKKLEAKGYEYNPESDFLSGEFNGEKVLIGLVTNNNKIWRVAASDRNYRNELQIKIRFNELLLQFMRNSRYRLLPAYTDPFIGDDEDISYEINSNKKQYEAGFIQNPFPRDSLTRIKLVEERIKESGEWEKYKSKTESERNSMYIHYLWELESETYKRSVWFCINKNSLGYHITIYYDNENNKANGEDL